MSLNRSIEFFRVSVAGDILHGLNVDSDDFFQSLQPFFQYNSNLKYLDFYYLGSHWAIINAIGASESSSLKAVSLSNGGEVNHNFEDELIRAITSRHPLCKISFESNVFTENSADDINAMLVNPHCKLKSLAICGIYGNIPSTIECIARGLDNNTSIKYLKCCGGQARLLLNFKTPNNTLEKLDLSIGDWNFTGLNLATQLKRLPALKSLKLRRQFRSSPRLLSPIFRAVLAHSSKLEELILTSDKNDTSLMTGTSLQILGECIVANASLKSLDVSNNKTVTVDGWKSFFHHLCSSSFRERVESINLSHIRLHDDMLEELLPLFVNSKTLSVLNLTNCNISSEGWRSLLEVLHRTSLEKLVGISLCDFTDETLAKLHQLFDNGNFNVSVFSTIPRSRNRFAQAVVEFLTGQGCRVEELKFELLFDGQQDLIQTASAWIESLSRNATLKSFSVGHNVSWRNSRFGLWPECYRLLCNTDTINATHSSNHMLQSLKFECVYHHWDDIEVMIEDEEGQGDEFANMPLEIYSMLQLNRGTNKAAVARRKVIQVHFSGLSGWQKLNDLNLGLKMMPQLLSWVGKESTEFSLMHNFLRDNPSLLDAGVEQTRKRKMY